MSDIAELLERCRKVTGPDRKIDARLSVVGGDVKMMSGKNGIAFFAAPVQPGDWAFLGNCQNGEDDAYTSLSQCLNVKHYTASIDAITALIERELPGWNWLVERDLDGAFFGRVGSPQDGPFSWDAGPLSSAPLALVCAFLSAKLAQVTE